ncbi:MAG: hypothetical protein ACYC43_09125 [Burkholderiales bacterium]
MNIFKYIFYFRRTLMTNNTITWNVQAEQAKEESMNVLIAAAGGLKNQVIASPVLADPSLQTLRKRVSEIADELHGLQQDVMF